MANAKKCDLCGKYYEWYASGTMFNAISLANVAHNGSVVSDDYKDCCPDCRDAIDEFIKNIKGEI